MVMDAAIKDDAAIVIIKISSLDLNISSLPHSKQTILLFNKFFLL